MSADARSFAATNLLASMLSGIPHTGGKDDLTFSLDKIESDDSTVHTVVETGSGDRFRVTVEWLSDESP